MTTAREIMKRDSTLPLDPELRGYLENLATALFPLADWIADKRQNGKYTPAGDLPWRQPGQALTPAAMGLTPFLEELLAANAGDETMALRWRQLAQTPLGKTPIVGLKKWRHERGLDAPAFGIVASDNIMTDAANQPTWRAAFYGAYWQPFRDSVKAANPQSPQEWQNLAADLFDGTSPHWPAGNPPSTAFVKQFMRDALHAMLNMRNPASNPWRLAFLIELGEHRRVGNSYTADDAARVVSDLRQEIPKPGKPAGG